MRAYAEWEEQELLFLSLPHSKSDWEPYLEEILAGYEELVAAITPFEKVCSSALMRQILLGLRDLKM